MWEDLPCHAEESGPPDEEPLKGSKQKRGTVLFVVRNYLPGSPGWVAQVLRTPSIQDAKAAGLPPGQGTYRNHPMSA